ncbi:MAG: hypothetical protein WD877_03085 [Candidatus Saccharimonadales bacterium]
MSEVSRSLEQERPETILDACNLIFDRAFALHSGGTGQVEYIRTVGNTEIVHVEVESDSLSMVLLSRPSPGLDATSTAYWVDPLTKVFKHQPLLVVLDYNPICLYRTQKVDDKEGEKALAPTSVVSSKITQELMALLASGRPKALGLSPEPEE